MHLWFVSSCVYWFVGVWVCLCVIAFGRLRVCLCCLFLWVSGGGGAEKILHWVRKYWLHVYLNRITQGV